MIFAGEPGEFPGGRFPAPVFVHPVPLAVPTANRSATMGVIGYSENQA